MQERVFHTTGRDALGDFAPMFAHLNDDILFDEIWNAPAIDLKTKCIVTVVSLIASGTSDLSLGYHLQNAKTHGVTKEEIAAIITHTAIYTGWLKGWAAFRMARDIWSEPQKPKTEQERYQSTLLFPIGKPNDAYAQYFTGQSYLAPVSTEQVSIYHVTFEPSCRNYWHIHHAETGGGQILLCVGGRGYYQEQGKDAVEMKPGVVVHIPPNTAHWHGAVKSSWFSHLAIEVPGENVSTEWLEPVTDEIYKQLI